MGKKRGNQQSIQNKGNIMHYFSPKRKKALDPENTRGDAQAQGKELNNQEAHSHEFLFKFDNSDIEFTIQWDHPQTVLQAITSKPEIREKIKCAEDKIILQTGRGHKVRIIATHFPCARLEDGELVTLTENAKAVEVRDTKRHFGICQKERYYVVYIDKEGGTNTKTKKLFNNSRAINNFTQLCVYGTENMTLRDAIDQDGRFVELGDFKLEDFTKGKVHVFSDDKMQNHEGKTFRISLEKNNFKKADKVFKDIDEAAPQQTREAASDETGDLEEAGPSSVGEAAALNAAPNTRWVLVSDYLKTKQAAGDSRERENVYEYLRAQFPELKKQLLKRFSDSKTEALKMLKETFKKVDFGKALQEFRGVGQTKDLCDRSNSVCKITVGNSPCGSGFVLFRHYILTNLHLFKDIMYNNNVQPDIDITAMFNDDGQGQIPFTLKVGNTFIDCDKEMDYAILELVVNEGDGNNVPPGLMKHCSPMPGSGEACIIGHPNGEFKQFDRTCIIEKENRENEVMNYLQQFKDFALVSVAQTILKQNIERIVAKSDPLFDKMVTYHSFMYHGSSGSPVFDAHCRLFGMHSGGFTYDFPTKGSVIEFAHPVLLILQKFVTNLRAKNNFVLLEAVKEELKDNKYLMEFALFP